MDKITPAMLCEEIQNENTHHIAKKMILHLCKEYRWRKDHISFCCHTRAEYKSTDQSKRDMSITECL